MNDRRLVVLAVLTAIGGTAILGSASAGTLEPAAPPAPTERRDINHARALAGAITVGDSPGYPVSILDPGSYVLTGDLDVPADTAGIVINTHNVSIDLNGFSIKSAGGIAGDGISLGTSENVKIKNGTVLGFGGDGVSSDPQAAYARIVAVTTVSNSGSGLRLRGDSSVVERCVASMNGEYGIWVTNNIYVMNSLAWENICAGLLGGDGSGFRANVLRANNELPGETLEQVSGLATDMGNNYCHDMVSAPGAPCPAAAASAPCPPE